MPATLVHIHALWPRRCSQLRRGSGGSARRSQRNGFGGENRPSDNCDGKRSRGPCPFPFPYPAREHVKSSGPVAGGLERLSLQFFPLLYPQSSSVDLIDRKWGRGLATAAKGQA
eukprot:422848-Amorphochlora_amoeboformis.AAC.1